MVDDKNYAQGALVQLRSAVDTHFARAQATQPRAMACKEGCTSCCQPGLSVFSLEAHRIQQALAHMAQNNGQLRARLRRQGQAERAKPDQATHCALLVDGSCSVYAERPLVCRSHGLAVRSAQHPEPSFCPLNYQDTAPSPTSILNLDAINKPLSVGASMWHNSEPGALRVSLADLACGDAPT